MRRCETMTLYDISQAISVILSRLDSISSIDGFIFHRNKTSN